MKSCSFHSTCPCCGLADLPSLSSALALSDSYKTQLAELEQRERVRSKENTGAFAVDGTRRGLSRLQADRPALAFPELKFELEQARTLLQSAEAELASSREENCLNQERVRELELVSVPRRTRARSGTNGHSDTGPSAEDEQDEDEEIQGSMGGELDDAMKGTTKTE